MFAICMLVLAGLATAQENLPQQSPQPPPLTTVQQVLDLGLDAPTRALFPVRLEGRVTYPDPHANMLYIQDATAGIRVNYTNFNFQPAPGEIVMVEGTVSSGMFAPYIDCSSVQSMGVAALPEPSQAPAARMAAGELSGQWVQVEGVIRDVAKDPQRALLFVSSGGLRFHAVIQPMPGTAVPVDWVDAKIVLRGVCWTDVDAENKPTGFTLYVPGTNQITFLHAGETNIFQQPTLSIQSHPELKRQADARLKVAGTVSFHSLSGHVYLQSDGGAVHARLLVPLPRGNPQAHYIERPPVAPLNPGEVIEVVGAPTTAMFAPLLQDAEFRRIGNGAPPVATAVTADEMFSGRFDGQLVSTKARLLASETRRAGALMHQVLALQTGDTIFEALWEISGTNRLPALAKNSYVQAVGICAVQLGELNQIRSFRLLMRDPGDLRLLGRPPWWEPLPVGKILWAGIALVAVALVWIWLLRRQVSQRTAQLQGEVLERKRAQTELHHALAAERELSELRSRFVSMVSHEFRTPLGVILSAAENLDTYFERLKPEQRRQQLQHVIQATGHMAKVMENVLLLGRAEAMEFKPHAIDLPRFCQNLANQVKSSTENRCEIQFQAQPVPTARGDEGLLRHILTNLLTNAVKYSKAGSVVDFSVGKQNGHAIFKVQDHGIGIPVGDQKQLYNAFHRGQNTGDVPGTGLGLVIVKRCVELHGGEIICDSKEGQGTTFEVRLPLFQEGVKA